MATQFETKLNILKEFMPRDPLKTLKELLALVKTHEAALLAQQFETFVFSRIARFNQLRIEVLMALQNIEYTNTGPGLIPAVVSDLILEADFLTNAEKCRFTYELQTVLQIEKEWLESIYKGLIDKDKSILKFFGSYLETTSKWHDIHLDKKLARPFKMHEWKVVKAQLLLADETPTATGLDDLRLWYFSNFNALWFQQLVISPRRFLEFVRRYCRVTADEAEDYEDLPEYK